MPAPDLLKLSLSELCANLADKQVSPVELMQATLDRIDEVNDRLNALVARVEPSHLMEQARQAEARIQGGEGRVFEGIPLGVKDLEDAQGLVTSHGSVPFKDNLAPGDSTQVARLKAAGAIVVGKTNAPEFGSTAYTKNLLFGATQNPWNLEFSPGGSSGGSSAALVSHMLPLVTASDGGGSVRIPACLTGAFGLKPSFGRIPKGPDPRWDLIQTSVHGPLTKTVRDAALFLDQVVGPVGSDMYSLPHPGHSYVECLERPESKLRIAFSMDFGKGSVQSEVRQAVDNCLPVFEDLGHSLETIDGGPPGMAAAWVYINNVEAYCHLGPMLAEHEQDFGRGFIQGVKHGAQIKPESLEQTIRRRQTLNNWCASVFDQFDLLITPSIPYDGHPARGPYPTEIDGKPAHHSGPGLFTIPFNMSWHPAATVRAGVSSRNLPMGLQIVGPRHRDDRVLQVAHAFEQARPWHPHWPEL